ncbi:hypothetical protein IE81DRAFT_349252 [Ceraceosorus guamensis]|uniref:Uncharacterized protein n=1 Tax=Ceraceosorus guamensis TaxID=1522189 RepID=A0A316VS83_9BASI|nr:hypothetical protein IE81DRAFT_349252 [Ceraceosorus guamensis]PWN40457.1 hypothetical protein IE81DRAFT_349252 [Ceraceosorus guamensis]
MPTAWLKKTALSSALHATVHLSAIQAISLVLQQTSEGAFGSVAYALAQLYTPSSKSSRGDARGDDTQSAGELVRSVSGSAQTALGPDQGSVEGCGPAGAKSQGEKIVTLEEEKTARQEELAELRKESEADPGSKSRAHMNREFHSASVNYMLKYIMPNQLSAVSMKDFAYTNKCPNNFGTFCKRTTSTNPSRDQLEAILANAPNLQPLLCASERREIFMAKWHQARRENYALIVQAFEFGLEEARVYGAVRHRMSKEEIANSRASSTRAACSLSHPLSSILFTFAPLPYTLPHRHLPLSSSFLSSTIQKMGQLSDALALPLPLLVP